MEKKILKKNLRPEINEYNIKIGKGTVRIYPSTNNLAINYSESVLVREYFGKYMIEDNSNGMEKNDVILYLKPNSKNIMTITSFNDCDVEVNDLGELKNLDINIKSGNISLSNIDPLNTNLVINRSGFIKAFFLKSINNYRLSGFFGKPNIESTSDDRGDCDKRLIKGDAKNSNVTMKFGKCW